MNEPIRVAVSGAAGRMGRASIRAITREKDMILVGALGRSNGLGRDAGELAGVGPLGVAITGDLEGMLQGSHPHVLVDFAPGPAAVANGKQAILRGVRPVIGGTGMSEAEVEELSSLARERGVGAVVAPNFALGAVLMMTFARQAARFFPHVEIVELHHDKKRDAPSGTAIKTARLLARERKDVPQPMGKEEEVVPGARGGAVEGIRIHSIRLPGLIAHQEVIFGSPGQTLTIRHDSYSEESFMPGLLLAIRKVLTLDHLVVGIEPLLGL
ncbi:MAG: 4-hydroxy-tetrahydrodipicolinate reductase [Armatimonadota bacterium]|nr:4-hydroxy-tetrahydrodipicolinate reductase [Armatimonadota bacterium]MDR5703809.1 4-hydroxy-tetrahydrodipicolinate reductase [Armatimonadota bacterium]MDR7434297.1 4-hydroxy-tetrahydrodipicolinate reductase [Armatimonadota bacterium]